MPIPLNLIKCPPPHEHLKYPVADNVGHTRSRLKLHFQTFRLNSPNSVSSIPDLLVIWVIGSYYHQAHLLDVGKECSHGFKSVVQKSIQHKTLEAACHGSIQQHDFSNPVWTLKFNHHCLCSIIQVTKVTFNSDLNRFWFCTPKKQLARNSRRCSPNWREIMATSFSRKGLP